MNSADLAAEDLRFVVRLGLERAGSLLTAGEHRIAGRIAALDGDAGRLFARLSARVPEVFEVSALEIGGVEDLAGALARLADLDLVDPLVPWNQRAAHLTVPRLKAACARLGLARTGRKPELVARLGQHRGFVDGPWVRVRHRGLIRRLERWAFLRRHRDRSTLVVERLGLARWPEYAPTPGPGVHRDRRAMLRWEALLEPGLPVPIALDGLAAGDGRAAGPLDLQSRLARALSEHARNLERSDPSAAAGLYARLADVGHPADPVRHSRALEQSGRPREALQLLRAAVEREQGPNRLAIHRAGRRLARTLRQGWAPDPPLKHPRSRSLRLPPALERSPRPLYRTEAGPLPVEAALISHLATLGRRAIHVENALWTTLFALCFTEAYFEPVPGALPCRWLSGPLDLGRPDFGTARRPTVDRILREIRDGAAPERIASAHDTWRGIRLAGAHWEIASDDLVAVARGMGGAALAEVLGVLLVQGWRAARGLPDLAILPGETVRLPHAVPERLGPGLVLAEVKGPGDTVRDAQRMWFHRLRSAGAPIALWEVRPLDPTC